MKEKIPAGKILVVISAVVLFAIVSIALLEDDIEAENLTNNNIELRAAIIDQLYDDIPNEKFHQQASELLESAGYEVDIFTTKQVTIDFFKNLPSMNYEFIVMRTHGLGDQSRQDPVMLFTGEDYTEDKYITEQLSGQIQRGTPLLSIDFQPTDSDAESWTVVNDTYRFLRSPVDIIQDARDEYFVIPPKFVEDSMIGNFPKTTFILGGCSTMSNPSMAQSLVKRGASTVIGWDNAIGNVDNDIIMLRMLENMLINNMNIQDAITESMEWHPPYTYDYPAMLKYFSEEEV